MRKILAAIALLALGAALVVASGVISIKASSGHMAATSWVLDFAKRRSVDTRSLGIDAPPLDDPAFIRLGAAHFDRGCRPCHGAPGASAPVIPARMTPHPPDLGRQAGRWRPRELFYIVAHGIKFTGMPAWPAADRTDEAWSVVAFLRALPRTDAAAYARLVTPGLAEANHAQSPAAGVVTQCAVCHRPELDAARSPLVPVLAGQRAEYVQAALDAYAAGRRKSGIMQPIAAALDAEARVALAAQLAAAGEQGASAPDSAAAARSTLVSAGDPGRDIPPCASCHGPAERAGNPRYPRLAGQPEAYLRLQLHLFAEDRRGGSDYGEIMRAIAVRLTPQHIDEAVRAYAARPGERP